MKLLLVFCLGFMMFSCSQSLFLEGVLKESHSSKDDVFAQSLSLGASKAKGFKELSKKQAKNSKSLLLSFQKDKRSFQELDARPSLNGEKKDKFGNTDSVSNPKPKKENPKNKLENSLKKELKGRDKTLIKSDLNPLFSPLPTEKEVDFIISTFLTEKSKKRNCPADYEFKNEASLYVEIQFINTKKNSCVGSQAKESYVVNKKWDLKRANKKNFILSYNKILNWSLDLFFFSYIKGIVKTQPKEFTEHQLDKACPSCSFRFEYDYKVLTSGDAVETDIKAFCVDKRRAFSKLKQDTYFINNWSCVKKEQSLKNTPPFS